MGRIFRANHTKTNGGKDIYWHSKWAAEQFARVVHCEIHEDPKWVMSIDFDEIRNGKLHTMFEIECPTREEMENVISYLETQGVNVKERIDNYDTWRELTDVGDYRKSLDD